MSESVLDIFREEAREHLGALEGGILDLETAAAERRRGLIDSLFRHAHSLKGDAKAVGVLPLKEATQVLEDLLDTLRNAPEDMTPAHVDQGLAQLDRVRTAYESWQGGAGDAMEESESSDAVPFDGQPDEPPTQSRSDPPVLPAPPAPTAAAPSPKSTPISNDKHRNGAAAAPPEESFTVRVTSERLDRMLNLAGESLIALRSVEATQARLADLSDHLEAAVRDGSRRSAAECAQACEFALDQVRRVAGEVHARRVGAERLMETLQADVRQARLLPLTILAESLRRVVRDLSQTLGKPIRYDIDVGQILLDKAVLESLREPLLHLLRNAADHGLESPAARRAAGKPEEGVIRLRARQQGPAVRLTLSDDGRGVNFDRIRARLRAGGATDDEAANLSERELIPYLFRAGFTTAAAGDVSGRGVGLDVVADVVRRLQGDVEIEGSSPAGTTFGITVPVTVSTVRVVAVTAGGQTFGVLSSSVVRTGRAARADLRELEGAPILNLDGEPLRWTELADLLGLLSSRPATQRESRPYLVVAQADARVVVGVDEVEDESEVLLKPLGFPLDSLPGLLGAALRADGSVQLLLDLAATAMTDGKPRAVAAARDAKPARRILVVDDSPTTRAIMRNVFTAAGYSVVTATDGMDALERLRSQRVQLVVSDVEMPRLNGFDLTRQIKAKFDLPVILVTGREQEEHRREGMEAGADAYVVKSTFAGESLLQIVEQWM